MRWIVAPAWGLGDHRGMVHGCRILLAGLLATAWGCGDGIAEGPIDALCPDNASCIDDAPLGPDAPAIDAAGPDATEPDAGEPDANACPAPAFGEIGGACEINADCTSAGFQGLCQKAQPGAPFQWPEEGFCFRKCTINADCGPDAFCTDLSGNQARALGLSGGEPERYCFPKCCEGDTCPADRVCGDAVFGFITLEANACFPGQPDAVDGDACETFGDCNVSSSCRTDPVEEPTGACMTLGCTVGDDSTCAPGGDGHCIDDVIPGQPFGLPMCVDTCESDDDCRIADGYFCRDETAAGLGKFCWHAQIGDACADDADCGGAPMVCDTTQPGGYCTVACTAGADDCPDNDVCVDPGGGASPYCADICNPDDPSDPNDSSDPVPCRDGYACTPSGDDSVCLPAD